MQELIMERLHLCGAAILTYTFLKYTLSLCTKVYLILGICTKVYLKNLANLDADTKVYL